MQCSPSRSQGGLILDVKLGELLLIDGEKIKVELIYKSGRMARLRINAPKDVTVNLQHDNEVAVSVHT